MPDLLLDALDRLEDGRPGEARERLDDALAQPMADPGLSIAAARVAWALRLHNTALGLLEALPPDAGRVGRAALALRLKWLELLGRVDEAAALLEQVGTDDEALQRLGLDIFLATRNWDEALPWAKAALAADPSDPELRLVMARILLETGRSAPARKLLRAAWAGIRGEKPGADRLRRQAAELLLTCGGFEELEALLRARASRRADDRLSLELLGELALWGGQAERAGEFAERLGKSAAGRSASLRILGAAAVLDGRSEDAEKLLTHSLELDEQDYLSWAWRGEARLMQDRAAEGNADLDRATTLGGGFLLGPRILRLAVERRANLGLSPTEPLPERSPEGHSTHAHVDDEVGAALEALFPGAGAVLRRRDPVSEIELLERALPRLAGNRGRPPTAVEPDGRLRLLPTPRTPRQKARWALEQIRVESPDKVLARFAPLIDGEQGAEPLALAHRGELYLWLGRLEEAEADFQAALELDEYTRWGYIGLQAVALMRERYRESMELNDRCFEVFRNKGASTFIYEGECLRRMGRIEEAGAVLEEAKRLSPSRLSAWINLALVQRARGDDAGFDALFAHLRDVMPGLLSDACEESEPGLMAGAPVSAEVRAAVLEDCLSMMRGNRSSSCPTYFTHDGVFRRTPRPPQSGRKRDRAHHQDGALIERARRALERLSD